LKIWEARRLDKVMASGRTHPLVLECEWKEGREPSRFQIMVVKAVGLPEVTEKSLFNELFGNMLANEFGISTPAPGLVHLSEGFAKLANSSAVLRQHQIQIRAGLGVGCEYFSQGFAQVIPGTHLTVEELEQAAQLYAFDLLIQNPDRTARKPNCAFRAKQLMAYDFELGFSFLLPVIGLAAPWQVSAHGISTTHVFRPGLKEQRIDWQPFIGALRKLSKKRLIALIETLPEGWRAYGEQVAEHLLEARSKAKTLELELQRSLL
jgi:hypothetical protein